MMKTFKQFNENNAMDFLKPKSEENIRLELDGLSDLDKIIMIYKYKLLLKHLPLSINKSKDLIIKNIIDIITVYEDNIFSVFGYDIIIKEETTPSVVHRLDEINLKKVSVSVCNRKFNKIESYDIPYDKINLKNLVKIYNCVIDDYDYDGEYDCEIDY